MNLTFYYAISQYSSHLFNFSLYNMKEEVWQIKCLSVSWVRENVGMKCTNVLILTNEPALLGNGSKRIRHRWNAWSKDQNLSHKEDAGNACSEDHQWCVQGPPHRKLVFHSRKSRQLLISTWQWLCAQRHQEVWVSESVWNIFCCMLLAQLWPSFTTLGPQVARSNQVWYKVSLWRAWDT